MKPSKRIAILGPAYPYRGGIASFNERLALEFLNHGFQVRLFNFTLQYPSIFFPGKNQYHDGPQPKGLDIVRTLNSINPISWITTANKINDFQPDLLISRFWHPYLGPSIGHVLKKVKAKNVVVVDNVYPHEKTSGQEIFIKNFMRQVHVPIAMSKTVSGDLSSFFEEDKIIYSPHPLYDNYGSAIDKSKAKDILGLEQEAKYILFFGLIRKYKGLDLLLKAFKEIHEQLDNTSLLVAGEFYDDQQKYESLIDELGIRNKVIIHPEFIPNDKVAAYFSASDLIAQTYKTATQSGISQIAIHFHKPLLLTKVGGLSEIIEDGKHGVLVDPEPLQIANGIVRFFRDMKPSSTELNISDLSKEYSWTNFYEKIILHS